MTQPTQRLDLSLTINSDGSLDSHYPVGNKPAAYQLASGYYTPARFALEAFWPRPNAEVTMITHHTHAYAGMKWEVPIRPRFGAYPYYVSAVSLPAGATIGSWLVTDGFGDLVEDNNYLTLIWDSPTTGTHAISVTITDQQGASVNYSWTLTVATTNHYFAASSATGDGSGSSPSNFAAISGVYGINDAAVSPAQGKILVLGTMDFTFNFGWHFDATKKPNSIINYPGTTPIFRAGGTSASFIRNSPDNWISGIKFFGFGGGSGSGPSSVVWSADDIDRVGGWRNTFEDCFGTVGASDNESCWYFGDNGAPIRQYIYHGENTYTNCVDICAFDFYACSMMFERDTFTTTQVTLTEPIWFPKGSNQWEMRRLRFDNPLSTLPTSGVLACYNNELGGRHTIAQSRYNFVRGNQAEAGFSTLWNAATTSQSADCYDERNTLIGGYMSSRVGTGTALVTFDSDAVQNIFGGYGFWEQDAAYVEFNTEAQAVSGVFDSNGRLTGSYATSYRGKRGSQIWGG